jgi:ABC-type phosphate transport system auxiliary subunit
MSTLRLGNSAETPGLAKAAVDRRIHLWQRKTMPTDVAKSKVTPMEIIDDLARLTARQLETVIEHASALRLQKRQAVMSERESEILRAINRGLSAEKSARLQRLQEKLRHETIQPREHKQLLRLSDELEKLAAQRLKGLIELALLRKTSVPKLMSEMGLTAAAYA